MTGAAVLSSVLAVAIGAEGRGAASYAMAAVLAALAALALWADGG